MKRHSSMILCIVTLLAGLAIGSGIDSWPFTSQVEANAISSGEADAIYRELGSGRSVLADVADTLAKIAKVTTPSVVHIQSERQSGRRGKIQETGSGVIVKSSKVSGTFVVTNRHVVSEIPSLKNISIHIQDGRVIHPVRIWQDIATDIAVLKVNARNLQAARWGNSDEVEIGHLVMAMGSPFGLSQSVTLGIISAKGRRQLELGAGARVLNQDFLQTDAAINPGNSGGPLIDLHGRAIAINTAIASNSGGNEGIGFSIPSNLVRRVVDQLLEHGKVQRAYLGVKLDPDFDIAEARRLKLDRARGARVLEVYPNTPASRANLKFDDVILSFGGIDIQDENHLINLVSLTPVGKRVRFVVLRNGKRTTVELALGDRASLEEHSKAPQQPGMGTLLGQLGLTLHELNSDIATQIGYSDGTKGLLVLKVDAQSTLSDDLRVYDLIEEVSRTPVSSVEDLNKLLHKNSGKKSILLKVRRQVDGRTESQLVVWQQN